MHRVHDQHARSGYRWWIERVRHSFELVDIVIDNGAPYGDAAVPVEGFPQPVSPLSSATGISIVNAIVAETVAQLVDRGVAPPVVRTVEGEDAIVIRPMMHVALSYDHRAVDGAPANGFLYRIRELLEAADYDL